MAAALMICLESMIARFALDRKNGVCGGYIHMKKNWISIILILIAIGLGICSWFLLPEAVAVQVGMNGQVTNTMPKLLAILIPMVISAAGVVMNLTNKEENSLKGFILALAGIAVMILTLFFNR